MGDVSAAIRHYIENVIRLLQADISASAKSREWFLDRVLSVIRNRAEDGVIGPVLYAPKKVGFGSYFKGTKVQVVDEYDILLVVDANGGVYKENGSIIAHGEGTANPNQLFNGNYNKDDGSGVSPAKLLNWLKSVVEEVVDSFGGTAPIRNGQAITAHIESQDISIDLVPGAILTRVSDGRRFYAIPRGDAGGGWIATAPEDDKSHLAEVAEGKQDFRNVVRILKRVKDQYNFKVSSFAIETDVVNYAASTWWTRNLTLEVKTALKHLAESFQSGIISDPFDPQTNMVAGVDSLAWYAERIGEIIQILDECAQEDDQERVVGLVHGAFEND